MRNLKNVRLESLRKTLDNEQIIRDELRDV